jgi:predicted neutral ceramidase superfamily lipid hydrolase
MLNYLTLRISDKEIRDAFTTANANLLARLVRVYACLNTLTLAIYSYNHFFGNGDLYLVVVNAVVMLLYFCFPFIHRYKKTISKFFLPSYLIVHATFVVLLFWELLGPLNVENKGAYQN